MYDPTIGQFLSEDPIGLLGGDANFRRYVGNGPTYATDPSGLIIEHQSKIKRQKGESREDFDARLAEQEAREETFNRRLVDLAMSDNDTLAAAFARQALDPNTTVTIVWTTEAPTHSSRGGNPDDKGKPGRSGKKLSIFLDPRSDDYLDPAVDRARLALDNMPSETAALIVIAHELGHTMGDLTDPSPTNPGGGNVTLCENELRRVLGVDPRRDYEGTRIPYRDQVNRSERARSKIIEDEEYGALDEAFTQYMRANSPPESTK